MENQDTVEESLRSSAGMFGVKGFDIHTEKKQT
jgi:hypothetical protein